MTPGGVATLTERACAIFPALEGASFVRAWAGLRPVSRDALPWLGPVPDLERLFVAAGHGRNGILLAPITAERLRDQILGKRDTTEGNPFLPTPERFAALRPPAA